LRRPMLQETKNLTYQAVDKSATYLRFLGE